MRWEKRGVVFAPQGEFDWMKSHASIPVADFISDRVMRVYFGTRDDSGRSHIGYVDVDADYPQTILDLSRRPVLPLGRAGTFDDSGTMPSWLVNYDGMRRLYYIGWNPQVTVSYRLAIGLASSDGLSDFVKHSEGPVMDRSIDEPFFNTAPCVLHDDRGWHMWYISTTAWENIEGRPEPRYHVKYAHSSDGLNWIRTQHICIDYDHFARAIGRPCVVRTDFGYEMFYSFRGLVGYRTDPAQSYRLGYAVSRDGLTWERRDSQVGIERSESGWDSQMMEYCFVYERDGVSVMLYNGNGFGQSGFGLAIRAPQ